MKREAKQIIFSNIPNVFSYYGVGKDFKADMHIYYYVNCLNKMLNNELNESSVITPEMKYSNTMLTFSIGILKSKAVQNAIAYSVENNEFVDITDERFNYTGILIPVNCLFNSLECNKWVKKMKNENLHDIIEPLHKQLSEYVMQFIILS